MEFLKKNKIYLIEIGILLITILFTLHIENKFEKVAWIHDNYNFYVIILILVTVILAFFKIQHESNEKDCIKENEELLNESKYLQELISTFKYQISKPLEDKLHEIYQKLSFNSNHRITVYTYTKGCFFSIARYSSNQNYSSFGRIAIKSKDEFIFKVWNGENKCENLYVCSDRKMPTKKACAHFLYEKNDTHPEKDRIGLVVFESIKSSDNKFNNGKFLEYVKEINSFINKHMEIKQDLNFAIQEGL